MSQFTMYKVERNVTSRCTMSDCSIRQRFFVLFKNTAQIPHYVLLICSDHFTPRHLWCFTLSLTGSLHPSACSACDFFLPEGAAQHHPCQPARTCCDHVCSEQQWVCHTTKHKLVCVHWQWVCWGWCLWALKEFRLWNCIWTGNKQIKKTSISGHVSTVN